MLTRFRGGKPLLTALSGLCLLSMTSVAPRLAHGDDTDSVDEGETDDNGGGLEPEDVDPDEAPNAADELLATARIAIPHATKVARNQETAAAAKTAMIAAHVPVEYANAVYDFEKARQGTGANRRTWIRNGATHFAPLLQASLVGDRANHDALEKACEDLWDDSLTLDSIDTANDDQTLVRTRLVMDAALNVIYTYLPTTINDSAGTPVNVDDRVTAMKAVVRLLPVEHRRKVYPIFVIERKPAGDSGGGTWKPAEVKGAFQTKAARTNIPFEHLEKLLGTDAHGNILTGMVGIPRNRMNGKAKNNDQGKNVWGLTTTHELGHSVDFVYTTGGKGGLQTAPAGDPAINPMNDLPGQIYNGNKNPPAGERVAEAYERYLMFRSTLCQTENLPPYNPGDSEAVRQTKCNKAALDYLNKTVAGKARAGGVFGQPAVPPPPAGNVM